MSHFKADYDGSKPLPNGKDEIFCQESVALNSLHKGYEVAGFKRPRGNAERKSRQPNVAKRLAHLWSCSAKAVEMMGGRHLVGQDRIANGNILDFWDIDAKTGQLNRLNLNKVPHAMGAVIQEIGYDSKGRPKLKLHDAGAAQRFIIERLAPQPQRLEVTGRDGGPIENLYGLSDDQLTAIARGAGIAVNGGSQGTAAPPPRQG